ncbi:heat-inducible transcriptional repressor HrcA [Texcoconibacillus texcoconensis]|uniref:Heat-inducible transcription repressor HrcA n=1 Tax=Texcoconibacillus texcoconensis TaxID=1095777 RepID=A0A840QRK1_9BACI|nr:heat-inducible transcriptional repressor HrcA [Texcoconibacillus texcoconensis]MBB5173953.1 heat-inducible transcriptional repressor [Texcoconibacillus texcoconensis]
MLSERQLLILEAIIDDYIRFAEPVGSRSVSKRRDVKFSPATIRNDMADLEELGFLEKPHSSAGRIPSQKAYRYYVDHLLAPKDVGLSRHEIADIDQLFTKKFNELEKVIQHSANILSDLTRYTSIVLGPAVFSSSLQQIQLVPISPDTAVAIIVTDTGHVEKQTVSIPEVIQTTELEKFVKILNDRLRHVPLIQLQEKINTEVRYVLREYLDHYEEMIGMLNETINPELHEQIYYSGKTNILAQPEFRDVDRIREMMNMFEEESLIYRLFRSQNHGMTIRIGEENDLEPFDQCTIITASYSIDGKHMGTVGILGPTRMEYRRVIGILDYISKDLSKLLTNLYQRKNEW